MRDILDSIELIEGYVRGMTYDQFAADRRTIDAVIRNFAIIGEAANHIPAALQQRYPSVAWDEMRRMRNFVVHIYFGIDLPTVWRTVQEDLTPLKAQLAEVLRTAAKDK